MIQIDMEMPERCDRCPLCNENIYVCEVNGSDVEYEWDDGLKPVNCPLKSADDVAPVIHAKWIGFPYRCSNCGQRAPQETYYGVDGLETSDYTSNYCPHCSAKMDKENKI